MTSYVKYPESKPFVNTGWVHLKRVNVEPVPEEPYQPPSKAFPESNRDLIMSTLRKLQKKLNKLESEKMSECSSDRADLGIHSRSTSSKATSAGQSGGEPMAANPDQIYTAYPVRLGRQQETDSVAASIATSSTRTRLSAKALLTNDSSENSSCCDYVRLIDEADGCGKLVNTERRVVELERQLEQMKRLLNKVEDKVEHKVEDKQLQQQREANVSRFDRYAADKLHAIRRQRKETTSFESDTTLFDVESSVFEDNCLPTKRKQPKSRSSKQTKVAKACQSRVQQTKLEQQRQPAKRWSLAAAAGASRSCSADSAVQHSLKGHAHYRLKLERLPFCVGQSTTPSHNLASSIQNVMSLLKQHHPKLCNSTCASSLDFQASVQYPNGQQQSSEKPLQSHTRTTNSMKRSSSNPSSRLKRQAFVLKGPSATVAADKKTKGSSKRHSSRSERLDSTEDTASGNENGLVPNLGNNNDGDEEDSNLDWSDCLRVLQEEYTRLVLQHYDLTKQIIKCQDEKKRAAYESKAEYLNKKIKSKAKQIDSVKSLQQQKEPSPESQKQSQTENLDGTLRRENERPRSAGRKATRHKRHSFHSQQAQQPQAAPRQRSSTRDSSSSSRLNKSTVFHSSTTSLFNQDSASVTSGFSALQLFKDIKNLQMKIQNDLDY